MPRASLFRWRANIVVETWRTIAAATYSTREAWWAINTPNGQYRDLVQGELLAVPLAPA